MSITIKSTKSVIFAAYTEAQAELQAQRHTIRAMRDELAMAKPVNAPKVDPVYKNYLLARAENAREAFASGAKVASFPSFAAWSAH